MFRIQNSSRLWIQGKLSWFGVKSNASQKDIKISGGANVTFQQVSSFDHAISLLIGQFERTFICLFGTRWTLPLNYCVGFPNLRKSDSRAFQGCCKRKISFVWFMCCHRYLSIYSDKGSTDGRFFHLWTVSVSLIQTAYVHYLPWSGSTNKISNILSRDMKFWNGQKFWNTLKNFIRKGSKKKNRKIRNFIPKKFSRKIENF